MLISCVLLQSNISLYSQNWLRSFKPHSKKFFLNHEDNKFSRLLAVVLDAKIHGTISKF